MSTEDITPKSDILDDKDLATFPMYIYHWKSLTSKICCVQAKKLREGASLQARDELRVSEEGGALSGVN